MFERFTLKDFKCHEGVNHFDLPGITVVSGSNNSGKSSLLQGMYLLSQTKYNFCPILSIDEILGLGSFSDVIHVRASNNDTIELSVEFDQLFLIKQEDFSFLRVNLVFKNPYSFEFLSTYNLEDTPILSEIQIEFELENEVQEYEFKLIDQALGYIYGVSGSLDKGFCNFSGVVPDSIIYEDLSRENKVLPSILFDKIRFYLSLLNTNNIHYMRAFRVNEFNTASHLGYHDVGVSGEYTAEILYKRWSQKVDFVDESGRELIFGALFNAWIKYMLGDNYQIRVNQLDKGKYKIMLKDQVADFELELHQVGFGISQLLPVLTVILSSKQHDLLLIENPEVHLHPRLQALFVDLCIFALKSNRKVVVETHSEHIINRIRLKIKESPELLDKINVLFFENDNGIINYTDIEMTKEGKISYWPKGFFDQSYYDLIGLIKDE
ncbi:MULTISPECIES: AAA family ATPase [Bacillus cereus group]|uniref:AAA family ATPase n=1 Tax=Bacillus cereus group TaxID=86661 RepID=UPI000BEDA35B|nr:MULTISPECIES: DUF3696 domain-containing protein [Bacillus cereus group]PEC73675.1 hypothetical protein CON25_11370 [Bacillus thuringiensis]PGW26862.1 hypothetical protein COD88_15325 [Bacillus cereus]PGZ67363.1 hypothetical protein COE61_26365 [Bacillus thuringiensis]